MTLSTCWLLAASTLSAPKPPSHVFEIFSNNIKVQFESQNQIRLSFDESDCSRPKERGLYSFDDNKIILKVINVNENLFFERKIDFDDLIVGKKLDLKLGNTFPIKNLQNTNEEIMPKRTLTKWVYWSIGVVALSLYLYKKSQHLIIETDPNSNTHVLN